MTTFSRLIAELDAWVDRPATLWWRDDDAMTMSPGMAPLLELSDRHCQPVVIATIPFGATAALAESLARRPQVRVWQHGIRHFNRAGPGRKKQELTGAPQDILQDLIAGRERLSSLFGGQFQPALVPPWNRIGEPIVAHLALAGFRALSTYKPRLDTMAAAQVYQVNTHVDLMSWRPSPAFRGGESCLTDLCNHLAARRRGEVDSAEPTGLLSHHKVMTAEAWDFLAALFAATKGHQSCQWIIPTV